MKRFSKITALLFALLMAFSVVPAISASALYTGNSLIDLVTKKTVDLSKCKITVSKTASYTGKAVKPKVTVKYGDTTLKKDTHYTVSYSSNKKIGTAKVKITGIEKNGYTGTKTVSFKIVPAKPSVSVKNKTTSSFTLSWKTVKGAKKYYIYKYDTKKKKFVKVTSTTKTAYTVKKLSSAKKYTYAVKAFAKENYLSDYSKKTVYTLPGAVKTLNVKANDISAVLTWKKVTRATGYIIYKYDTKTKKYKKADTTKKLSYTVKNLSEKTSYKYAVAAYFDSQTNVGAKKAVSFKTTAITLPDKVNNFTVSVKNTDVSLSWKKVSDATGYNLYTLDEKTGKYTLLVKLKDVNSYSYKEKEGQVKTYAVSAYKTSGKKELNGKKSDTKTAYIPLSAVTNLKLSLNNTTLTVSFDKKEKAQSYTVYTYNEETKKYSTLATVKEGLSHSFTVKEGTAVSVAVSADFIYGGKVIYGNKSAVSSYVLPFEAVEGLQFKYATETSVTLSWNKKSGATGYNIYSYDSAKKTYALVLDAGNNNSATVSGLSAGKNYSYAVSAYFTHAGKKVSGKYSAVCSASTLCVAPSGLSLDDRSETSITLKWSSVPNADSYNIYSYNSSTAEYKKLSSSDKASFTVTGLEKGKTYYFAVSSVKKVGNVTPESKKSEPLSFATLITPEKVKGVKTSIKSNKATVKWTETNGANGYIICSQNPADSSITVLGTTDKTEFTFDIPNGKAYTIAVKAFVQSKSTKLEGPLSDSVYVILPFDAVTNLKVVTSTEYSVTLSWDKKTGVEGYDIFAYNSESDTYMQILDAGNNTSFSVKNLEDNTTYFYAVGAYFTYDNQKITGNLSNVVKATTKPYIEPSNIKITAYTENSMNIKWNAVSDAKSYNIYSYNADTKQYTLLGNSNYPFFVASGLESGKSHSFAVSVLKEIDGVLKESNKSNIVTAYSTKTMPQNMKKVYDTLRGNSFSLKYAVPYSENQTIPTEFYYKNGNFALVANMSMDGLDISSRTLYLKDKDEAYILLPMGMTGFYTKMSASELKDDGMDASSLVSTLAPDVHASIPYTVVTKLYDGKTYTCETYVSTSGGVVTYYFYNGNLTDIELVDSVGSSSFMTITSLSASVDDKIFKLPTLFPIGWTKVDI